MGGIWVGFDCIEVVVGMCVEYYDGGDDDDYESFDGDDWDVEYGCY